MKKIFLFIIMLAFIFAETVVKAQNTAANINSLIGIGTNSHHIIIDNELAWPESYFQELAAEGFTSIRINFIEGSYLYPIDSDELDAIQDAVDYCNLYNMVAVIDYHIAPAWFTTNYSESQENVFISNWGLIANRFSGYDFDKVVYQLCNEPSTISGSTWNALVEDAVNTIRVYDNEKAIMVPVLYYGSIRGVHELEIPDDNNLILDIHYYEPHWITVQNCPWIDEDETGLYGLDYANTDWVNIQAMVDNLEQDFKDVFDFQEEHDNIPVCISEWGSLIFVDEINRINYAILLTRWFEEQGFSHIVWDYDQSFGIMYNPDLGYGPDYGESRMFFPSLVDAITETPLVLDSYSSTTLVQSDFSTTTGWGTHTAGSGVVGISVANNELRCNVSAVDYEYLNARVLSPTFNLEKNHIYRVSYTVRTGSGTKDFAHKYSGGVDPVYHPWYYVYDLGTTHETIVNTYIMPTTTQYGARFEFLLGGSTGVFYIENFILEELTPIESSNNVLAHWPFDGDGTDASGNGNNISEPELGESCFSTYAKKGSHAAFFWMNSAGMDIGTYSFDAAITLSYWANYEPHGVFPILEGTCPTGESLRIEYDDVADHINIITDDGAATDNVTLEDISTIVSPSTWHHYVFMIDPSINQAKIFIDGTERTTIGSILNIPLSEMQLVLGGSGQSPDVNYITLDDVQLFNGLVSQEQIDELSGYDVIIAPDGLFATIDEAGTHLSWTDNADNETHYQVIKYGPTGQPCAGGSTILPANTETYTDPVITSTTPPYISTHVTYIVVAFNTNGQSDRSAHLNLYSIITGTEGSGTVESDKFRAIENSIVNVKAIPSAGWKFIEWTGDISSTSNPVEILIDVPKSITAIFEEGDITSRTMKVNFGPSSLPGPSDWNNLYSHTANSQIPDLLDVNSGSTGIGLRLVSGWTSSSTWGDYPGIYPDNVMRGYFYINNDNVQTIELNGLDGNNRYDITLFASRKEYAYTTNYTIGGTTQSINVQDNTQDTVYYEAVSPDANGIIEIDCQRASGSQYGYINAMVIIEKVSGTNLEPVAVSDGYTEIDHGEPYSVNAQHGVLANDSDPEGQNLSAVLVSDVSQGILSLNADGSFEYTHTGTSVYTDAFTYMAFDGELYSEPAIVSLEVYQIPDPEATRIKINFGPVSLPGSSDWNNFSNYTANSEIADLTDIGSEYTGIGIRLIDSWTNSSTWGDYPGIYPDNVMRGYFYINNDNVQTIELNGLDGNNRYDITLFASRKEYAYTTNYTIGGTTQSINVQDNTQDTVYYESVSPDANGIIEIDCQRASGSQYGYINAMVLYEYSVGSKSVKDFNKQELSTAIRLYPNPVTNELFIENLPENSIIRIYNILGEELKVVQNYDEKNFNIPMGSLANGTYTIQIINQFDTLAATYFVVKR